MTMHYPKIQNDALFPHLVAHLAANDFDEMPDGAWFATLEHAVDEFNELHKTNYDRNDAVHAYLEHISERQDSQ